MAWPTKKLPSGIPASHFSAGPGWGGPARGAGRGGPRRPFTKDSPTRVSFHTGEGDPAKMAERKRLAAEKEARIEQLIEKLGDIALNDENPMARISASVHALNRLDGKPVATRRKENRKKTVEEMILEAAKPREKPTG